MIRVAVQTRAPSFLSCIHPTLHFFVHEKQEDDIRRRTSAAGINADAASTGLGVSNLGAAGGGDEATQELAAAVESLPKLLEQKKGLEMHTNILKVRS